MSFLLDTHVFLWAVADDPRLGLEARKTLADPGVEVFVSPVTPWEIEIKRARQKLEIRKDYLAAAEESGFRALEVTLDHGVEAGRLPLHHRDPFDRMLVAQARSEGLTLVSSDLRIRAYDVAILTP